MFCSEPVDIQDDYHWRALILQRAFKRDFQTSSGLTSSIFPLRFLSRFWYPQKTVSHTESKDIYIISEWLDMTKLWGQEGGLILTQIAAQRLHPPPQHFLQPSPPPPFKKKKKPLMWIDADTSTLLLIPKPWAFICCLHSSGKASHKMFGADLQAFAPTQPREH